MFLMLLLSVLVCCFFFFSYSSGASRVLDKPDKAEAERLLDTLASRVNVLIRQLPEGPVKRRLQSRWHPDRLSEGQYQTKGVSSFTVNKGQQVVMCLRDEQGSLHDENLLMYVLLHEMAHIASDSVSSDSHNDEFFDRFHYLLEQAIEKDIYKPQNKNNLSYCTTSIAHLP